MASPAINLPYPAMDIRFWSATTTRCTVEKWNNVVPNEPWSKLYAVAEGRASYAIQRPGQPWQGVTLQPGRIYLIPGSCMHKNACRSSFVLHWCHFTVDAELNPRLAALPRIVSWSLAEVEAEAIAIISSSCPNWRLRAGALVLNLLARLPDPPADEFSAARERLSLATGHLEYFFTKTQTIADLAERCALRPSRFQQLFRQVHGTTPGVYLAQLRLAEACRLLEGTTLSVSEVGLRVGWDNPYHFSRIFRAKMGVSPRVWRQQTGAIHAGGMAL